MAESLAEYLSSIENVRELDEELKKVPIEIRGRVAELTAASYEKKFSTAENQAKIKYDDKNLSTQEKAQEIMKGLTSVVHNMPHIKICELIAFQTYSKTKDIDGLKRMGDNCIRKGNFEMASRIYTSLGKNLDHERKTVLSYVEGKLKERPPKVS